MDSFHLRVGRKRGENTERNEPAKSIDRFQLRCRWMRPGPGLGVGQPHPWLTPEAAGAASPQGALARTWEGQTNNTFQSYLCFSSCMSLPPTLKAKMSLLVLAYLSFSLVRSGESCSPQVARQKESR